MPLYVYRCPGGYLVASRHPMGEAPRELGCPCHRGVMTRVYVPLATIMRPENYSAHPEDPDYWKGFGQPRDFYRWQRAKDMDVLTPEEAREQCGGNREVPEA